MSDTFNVTGAITPANPTTGDTLTLTITGDDVHTVSTPGTIGPLKIALKSGTSGATSTITVAAVPCTVVTTSHESVVIVGVTDPAGRVWTPSPSGLTATATA